MRTLRIPRPAPRFVQRTRPYGVRAAAVTLATLLVLVIAARSGAASAGAWPSPDGAAERALGSGWGSWWSAHGKEVATVVGCFLDGVAAARWLALGGTGMAAAGLLAAGLACFG